MKRMDTVRGWAIVCGANTPCDHNSQGQMRIYNTEHEAAEFMRHHGGPHLRVVAVRVQDVVCKVTKKPRRSARSGRP